MMRSLYFRSGAFRFFGLLMALLIPGVCESGHAKEDIGLDNAVVVVRSGNVPSGEKTAARVLVEEVADRKSVV